MAPVPHLTRRILLRNHLVGMFDAAGARGGFPVLLPRRIDFPLRPPVPVAGFFGPLVPLDAAALPRAAACPSCRKRLAAPSRIRVTCSCSPGPSIHPSALACTVPASRPNCSANATRRCSIASADGVPEVPGGFCVAVGRSMHSPFDFRHVNGRRHATHRLYRPTAKSRCVRRVERSRLGVPWGPVPSRR
jgi:hypothetical protein